MHKRIVRSLAGVHFSHPTEEIYRQFSLLTISDINVYMIGIFVFKCIKSGHYTSWFQSRESTQLTRSTEQNLVHVPPIRTEHSKQCITYRGPTIWNAINFNIRNKSYDMFKIAFKSSLL